MDDSVKARGEAPVDKIISTDTEKNLIYLVTSKALTQFILSQNIVQSVEEPIQFCLEKKKIQ